MIEVISVFKGVIDILSSERLKELIDEHEKKKRKYSYYFNLYDGDHPILKRTTDDNKPNNRLVNDYYGQIIDTTIGYFLGNPIIITLSDEEQQEELENIFYHNDKDDLFAEVGKEACIKGKTAVLVYQDEDGETRLNQLPPEEVIFVYDSSKTDKLIYAIRVYEVIRDKKSKKYAEVYTKETIAYFIEGARGDFVLDPMKTQNPTKHIYNDIPIVPFVNNKEEKSDLAKIETLVNDFNKVFSDSSNEHEAYRNAYLMLKNYAADVDTLKKLKAEGVFEVDAEGDVKFVTKDVQVEALDSHLNRLEKNIHKFSQVPDLSDEQFASNLSGIAIKFKLFGLETKCITKERKMTKGIKKLLSILEQPIKVKTEKPIDHRKTKIKFTRNLPANILELADVVSKLNGVVDKETLLAILPFVENPQQVIEKLKEEVDSYAQDMKNKSEANNTQSDKEKKLDEVMNGEGE